jgi:hypothetical protein
LPHPPPPPPCPVDVGAEAGTLPAPSRAESELRLELARQAASALQVEEEVAGLAAQIGALRHELDARSAAAAQATARAEAAERVRGGCPWTVAAVVLFSQPQPHARVARPPPGPPQPTLHRVTAFLYTMPMCGRVGHGICVGQAWRV